MVIENSLGRLKARWRRLLKRFDGSIRFLLDVIVDCVILHNMCEELNMNQIRMPSFGYRIDGVEYRDPKYGLK
jgi:hypothetical protein